MSACLFFWIFVGSFHFNRRFTLIHSSLFNLVIQKTTTTTTTSLYSCSINTHTHARPSNIHQSSMMINVDDALKVRSEKNKTILTCVLFIHKKRDHRITLYLSSMDSVFSFLFFSFFLYKHFLWDFFFLHSCIIIKICLTFFFAVYSV